MLNKKFLERKDLSIKAKGLLAYLLSKPDDWIVYQNELIKSSKSGRKLIESTIKELINKKYIKRISKKRIKGKFTGYVYDIYETPFNQSPKGTSVRNEDTDLNKTFQPMYPNRQRKTDNGKDTTTNNISTNKGLTNINSLLHKESTTCNMKLDSKGIIKFWCKQLRPEFCVKNKKVCLGWFNEVRVKTDIECVKKKIVKKEMLAKFRKGSMYIKILTNQIKLLVNDPDGITKKVNKFYEK